MVAPATILVAAAFALSPNRLKWPLWLRAGWAIFVFVVLAALLKLLVGSPLHPAIAAEPGLAFWERLLLACWWFLGARLLIGLVRFIVLLERRPRETQILTDLTAGAVYVAAVLAIVNFVFSVPIGGLVATSGVIAIIVGLALQNTLGDVFSGIAVGLERPYRAGDFVWVEGGIEGQVRLVTWRSTHIMTVENDIAIIPNSVIAKIRLVNHSRPTAMRGTTIEVALDPGVAPERCIGILGDAVHSAGRMLLQTPRPEILCAGVAGDGCVYRLSFWVMDSERLPAATSVLLTEVHRHLRLNGIGLAVRATLNVVRPAMATLAELLEQSDLFGVLDAEDRNKLAEHFTEIRLGKGEVLFREGEKPEALYIIGAGVAEATVTEDGKTRVLRHFREGESLGATGLITGAPFAATATALTRLTVFKLDREALGAALKAQPRLAHGLETLAKSGQAALRRDAATFADTHQAEPEIFLSGLRHLVRLLKSRNTV